MREQIYIYNGAYDFTVSKHTQVSISFMITASYSADPVAIVDLCSVISSFTAIGKLVDYRTGPTDPRQIHVGFNSIVTSPNDYNSGRVLNGEDMGDCNNHCGDICNNDYDGRCGPLYGCNIQIGKCSRR